MAKAKYHKSQRVFVKPVGTWAHVEAVVPKWVKGCEEPIKIAYDCGMGREFAQEELEEESTALQLNAANGIGGAWRILRGHNRWKSADQCGHHPHPGTHPMIVTTERDWGGWRVPGAEYDLDPYRIEHQAEVIVRAPIFMKLLEEFVEHAEQEPENLSDDLTKLAQIARRIISEVSG
jgi:hypothetical protein